MHTTSDRPRVLVLGAGAAGMVIGYHLARGGAQVTFFVRPARMERMAEKPRRLFCYDDNELKRFEDYAATCDMSEVAATRYDWVISTLDGAAMRSDDGRRLLESLGAAIRDSDAILVCLGVMVGVQAYLREVTGLPPERCVFGGIDFLSHDVPLPQQRVPDEVDRAALSTAAFAYRHRNGKGGMLMWRQNRLAGKRFIDLYDRSGLSRSSILPNLRVTDLFAEGLIMPLLVGMALEDWPAIEDLDESEVWAVACGGVRELLALPEYGFLGRTASWFVTPGLCRRMFDGLTSGSHPLDFRAFNRFHHGGKVLAQDVSVVRDLLARAEAGGRVLPRLRELVARADEKLGVA